MLRGEMGRNNPLDLTLKHLKEGMHKEMSRFMPEKNTLHKSYSPSN